MEMVNGRKRRCLRVAALFLSGIIVACGIFFYGKIFCEAKETEKAAADKQEKSAADVEEQEIIEFVTSYYEAQTPEGIDTLADFVDDPLSEDFQRDLLRQRLTFEIGRVKGWENFKAIVLPMSDGKHWVVSVSSDLIVEGIDVGIPGLKVLLVGRNEEGELKIALYNDATSSDASLKEIRELSLSDEIVEHSNETAVAYNALINERSDVMEWALETQEAVDREMMEALAREEMLSTKTDSKEEDQEENTGEKPDVKNGSYTVQKGDCLWDIAEEQLGDGMRWSGLYEQNKDLIGENPDLLYVGITLQLD